MTQSATMRVEGLENHRNVRVKFINATPLVHAIIKQVRAQGTEWVNISYVEQTDTLTLEWDFDALNDAKDNFAEWREKLAEFKVSKPSALKAKLATYNAERLKALQLEVGRLGIMLDDNVAKADLIAQLGAMPGSDLQARALYKATKGFTTPEVCERLIKEARHAVDTFKPMKMAAWKKQTLSILEERCAVARNSWVNDRKNRRKFKRKVLKLLNAAVALEMAPLPDQQAAA